MAERDHPRLSVFAAPDAVRRRKKSVASAKPPNAGIIEDLTELERAKLAVAMKKIIKEFYNKDITPTMATNLTDNALGFISRDKDFLWDSIKRLNRDEAVTYIQEYIWRAVKNNEEFKDVVMPGFRASSPERGS